MARVTVRDARFIAEARDGRSLPPVASPEVAVAGRSNVGKSSLLNRLVQRRALARTSKTPGRTRGLIFYDLDLVGAPVPAMRIVDLPGYGYAQVAKSERRDWQTLIEGYITKRPTLALVLLLVDARRGAAAEEVELAAWLDQAGVPHTWVVTKVDKLGAAERGLLLRKLRGAVATSAETGEGVEALWGQMCAALTESSPAS